MTMTVPTLPRDRAFELAQRRRVQAGIEAAALVAAARARHDIGAVHRMTESMTRQALRQLVATLAAAMPARVDVRAAVSWLEDE